MAQTKIEWTATVAPETGEILPGFTFNPWRGCVEVSEGCAHCYAREAAKRNPAVLGEWGADKPRVLASDKTWLEPVKWNREAMASGIHRKVFCASIADVFEDQDLQMVDFKGSPLFNAGYNVPTRSTVVGGGEPYTLRLARVRLWWLIAQTPWLNWLLLTKRPENIGRMLPPTRNETLVWQTKPEWWSASYRNVWFGTTVENQRRAEERIPALCDVPCRLRFLSCEPLLGPLDLSPWLGNRDYVGNKCGIDWVIVGGESGHHARQCQLDWIDEIVGQCREARVPCFVKQLGKEAYSDAHKLELIDRKKGGEVSEWPNHLRVREFPDV